ncbi:MAG TPA: zinc finger CCHC domain-containing protein [Methylomicrobium sp.]|nr:zinc finger CCHC domain-containing protein [Methylomicrobium sp.]
MTRELHLFFGVRKDMSDSLSARIARRLAKLSHDELRTPDSFCTVSEASRSAVETVEPVKWRPTHDATRSGSAGERANMEAEGARAGNRWVAESPRHGPSLSPFEDFATIRRERSQAPADRLPVSREPPARYREELPARSSPKQGQSPEGHNTASWRRAPTIQLGSYDGTKIPLATHLARLENCSRYYGWNSDDRLCHLRASLDGIAASILWELEPDSTESDLLALLQQRFGDSEQTESYRVQLKARRRLPGESLQHLYQDVCRLLALSYPAEQSKLSQLVARDAFLDCLNDPSIRIRILEKDCTNIQQAYTVAARFEAFSECAAAAENEAAKRKVRAVTGVDQSNSKLDKLEQAVNDLQDGLKTLLQHQQVAMQRATAAVASGAADSQAATSNDRPSGARPKPPPSNGRQRARGRCFTCNAEGHYARDCPGNSKAASLRAVLPSATDIS